MGNDRRKLREAAALKYQPEENDAPVLVAIGRGIAADRIVEIGEEHDIPIVPDAELAHILTKLSVGDEIPSELYALVAQIMIFIGDMDRKMAGYMPVRGT